MKTLKIILVCLLAALALAAFIKGDDGIVEALGQKLWMYHKEHPAALLHLHLDKSIYSTNEDIWFKAYILNPDADSSKVLNVRLTDQHKKIIVADQFPISDIRANGDILIPDTLKEGSYYLYAFTNTMINYSDRNIFVQRITVKPSSSGKLYAEASVVDTTKLRRGQTVQVNIKLNDGDHFLKNIKGQYRLIADGIPSKITKISTNDYGETTINFVYPQLPDDKSLNVKISFKNNNDFTDLMLNLKHEGNPIMIRLYPEGGHLIAGVPAKAVLQATDINNNPVITDVVLKGNQQNVAQVHLNKSGLATINFIPQHNTAYTMEALSNGKNNIVPLSQTIENQGYSLKLSRQKDDFKVLVKNTGTFTNTTLILRSFEEILWSVPLLVNGGDSAVVGIPANRFPKQALSLGLFTSNGNLLAERLFMNRLTENYRVNITTDEQVYGARKKVTVSLHITDAIGKPVTANLSVSAVEKERTEETNYGSILNSYYLKFLDGNNHSSIFNSLKEAEVDELMITKNWYQSNWAQLSTFKPRGRVTVFRNSDGVVGYVKSLTKKPRKLKELMIISKSHIFVLPINDNNYFYIPAAQLIRDRSEKEYIILNGDLSDKYEINLIDHAAMFDTLVTSGSSLLIPETFNTLARYQETKQSFSKGAIQLKEVKINSGTSTENEGVGVYQSKNCNDMVCMYNILNCRNHPNCCTTPVDGGVYSYNGKTVIYKACMSELAKTHIPLKRISIPKQFYLPDYDKQASYEPELHSTIYWNPNINTDTQGNAKFSFYTSDITGNFLITAQGIDIYTIHPLYGTGKFTVK